MMPSIEVCVYCSHKIEEKETSVNLPEALPASRAPKRQRPDGRCHQFEWFPFSAGVSSPGDHRARYISLPSDHSRRA